MSRVTGPLCTFSPPQGARLCPWSPLAAPGLRLCSQSDQPQLWACPMFKVGGLAGAAWPLLPSWEEQAKGNGLTGRSAAARADPGPLSLSPSPVFKPLAHGAKLKYPLRTQMQKLLTPWRPPSSHSIPSPILACHQPQFPQDWAAGDAPEGIPTSVGFGTFPLWIHHCLI